MNLVEAYLRAVAMLLPRAQREDITAELRDLILSRIEAREAALGRPLREEEIEAVLREVGHPLVVAARYRGGPQHVVGPALYPYWLFAVKAAAAIQAALALVVFAVKALAGGDLVRAFDQALASAVSGTLALAGLATAVAWGVERWGLRIGYLDRWRVRDLKGLELAAWDWDGWRERWGVLWAPSPPRDWRRFGAPGAPRSVSELAGRSLGGIAWGVVLLLWWTGLLPVVLVGAPGDLRELGVDLGPLASVDWEALKAALTPAVVLYCVLAVAQGVLWIANPGAVRLQGGIDLLIAADVLGAAGWLWTASPLAPAVAAPSLSALAVRLRHGFDHGAPYLLADVLAVAGLVLAFGGVCRALRGAWELLAPRSTLGGAPRAVAGPAPFEGRL